MCVCLYVLIAQAGKKLDPAVTFHRRNVGVPKKKNREPVARKEQGAIYQFLTSSSSSFLSAFKPSPHFSPVPWSWLSLSRSIFKSLHQSWRSSGPNRAVTDEEIERKEWTKGLFPSAGGKYTAQQKSVQMREDKIWFTCNHFHLSPLEGVYSNILLYNDSFLPQECLWERLKIMLHSSPDRHKLSAMLATAWIYIQKSSVIMCSENQRNSGALFLCRKLNENHDGGI